MLLSRADIDSCDYCADWGRVSGGSTCTIIELDKFLICFLSFFFFLSAKTSLSTLDSKSKILLGLLLLFPPPPMMKATSKAIIQDGIEYYKEKRAPFEGGGQGEQTPFLSLSRNDKKEKKNPEKHLSTSPFSQTNLSLFPLSLSLSAPPVPTLRSPHAQPRPTTPEPSRPGPGLGRRPRFKLDDVLDT